VPDRESIPLEPERARTVSRCLRAAGRLCKHGLPCISNVCILLADRLCRNTHTYLGSTPFSSISYCQSAIYRCLIVNRARLSNVSLAPWFTPYTVNHISRDALSHLLTHLVVYTIALCSSLITTIFCLLYVCPVLPHPTLCDLSEQPLSGALPA
jgi:hypothetical protein